MKLISKLWPFLIVICLGLFFYHTSSAHLLKQIQKLPISSEIIGPPKGYVTAREYALEKNANYISVKPKQKIQITPFPISATSKTHKFGRKKTEESKKGIYSFPENFVLILPNSRVIGAAGVIITQDDLVIKESCLNFYNHSPEEHWIFSQWVLPACKNTANRIAVISADSADWYFHWMCDVLPKLEILRLSGVPYDKLYFPKLTKQFQTETLAKLKISQENIITGNRSTHLKAAALIVPSLPAKPTTVPAWVITFLREKFLPDSQEKADKRIYISRKKSSWRRLANEDEVFAYLKEKGFEEIITEDLSVEEQARLFASSEIIVAPHGAGLTNLVFASPQVKVIEFYHPDWLCECYWEITQQMKIQHAVLAGQAIPEPPFSNDLVFKLIDKATYDYTVDLDKVKTLVEAALAN